MKKRQLNISKLNLNKEVISNLNEIKGGDGAHKDTYYPCYEWDENATSAVNGSWVFHTGDSCAVLPDQPICDR